MSIEGKARDYLEYQSDDEAAEIIRELLTVSDKLARAYLSAAGMEKLEGGSRIDLALKLLSEDYTPKA